MSKPKPNKQSAGRPYLTAQIQARRLSNKQRVEHFLNAVGLLLATLFVIILGALSTPYVFDWLAHQLVGWWYWLPGLITGLFLVAVYLGAYPIFKRHKAHLLQALTGFSQKY